jgi:hypothetical protein
MRQQLWGCLDRWPFWVGTRPLAGLLLGGAAGGGFGALGGLVYGALHGALSFALAGALRGAFAGAVAGLLMGLCTAVDRASWPAEERDRSGGPPPPAPPLNGHASEGEPLHREFRRT